MTFTCERTKSKLCTKTFASELNVKWEMCFKFAVFRFLYIHNCKVFHTHTHTKTTIHSHERTSFHLKMRSALI